MKRRNLIQFAGLCTASTLLFTSCGGDEKPAGDSEGGEAAAPSDASASSDAVFRFSAIPDENTTEQKEKYQRLADYLAEALSVKVEFVPSTDYAASVQMFKNGEIHLAWFGGLTGVQARRAVEGAKAIAQGVEDPEYISYFIANASTGLEMSDEFPAAIADMRFTFGSKSSTSGRLMPTSFIIQNTGKKPEEFFTQETGFSGAHDKTAKLVEAGTFQVGALSYKTYDKMVAEGKVDPAVCKIIWKTPTYADYNFTSHPAVETTFGEGFTAKLQKALLDIKDAETLSPMNRSGIIEAKNEDFAKIEKVALELGFIR